MKKLLLSLFLLGTTLIPNYVSAETQIIEADGDYVLGDGETVSVAKEKSRDAAVRNASMQAAVFVESVLKVDSGMVSKDEITVITSNVLQLQKEPEYKNIVDDKSIIVRCHVIALIDTDNVEKIINNRELVQQMEQDTKQIKEDRDRLVKEVDYWKNKYKTATSDSERENAEREIKIKENSFTATEYFERGKKLYYTEKYSEAIEQFSKVIELEPNFSKAYYNRGIAYYELEKYINAIRDFSRSIEIDPKAVNSYIDRGIVYGDLGRYEDAIQDFSTAIKINPNSADAYYHRGLTYEYLKQYNKAIRDYRRVLEIDPNDDTARNNLEILQNQR